MISNIFQTLLCVFLIYLSCFIAAVRGKSTIELEAINNAEFDSSELNSKTIEETAGEGSVAFASTDKCSFLQCRDDEMCVVENGKFKCKVTEDKSACESNPCQNGGSCIIISDLLEGFSCYCADGFVGEKCEIDACSLLQCHETEICVVENGDVTCKRQDECDEMNCQNNGTCYIKEGIAVCKCPDGYMGELCEKHQCDGMNCQNNGTCYIIEGLAVCKCPDGYTGDLCEKHECDEMNCQNNGTCYVKEGIAVCKCLEGYLEDLCEKLDLCAKVCGENPGVVCEGDKTKRYAISCSCKDKDKIFDQEEKKCEVKKDINTACVFHYWQVSWETAVKQCTDEDSSLLCYKSRKEMDDILEAFRLTGMVTAKLAIWLGNRNCTSEKKKMEKCLSLRVEKSNNNVLHYFQTNCDEVNPFVCCVLGTNECDSVKCQNGGICKIALGKPVCECPVGYTGDVCEKHECDRVKCQNGGICKIMDGKAVCKCLVGYTGDVCEKHPCSNHSCQNGGRCIFHGENFKCICIAPFTGTFCEIVTRMNLLGNLTYRRNIFSGPCSNEPCLNGGQCVVTWRGFNCNCKEPYSGKFCETNLCAQYICKNNGICRVVGGEPKCFCKEPYGGKFCDIRMGECAMDICKNGGICRTINDEPKCFCVEPYGGKFCDTKIDLRYNSTIFAVVYMLLGLVLISIGVLIACLLCRRICLVKKY